LDDSRRILRHRFHGPFGDLFANTPSPNAEVPFDEDPLGDKIVQRLQELVATCEEQLLNLNGYLKGSHFGNPIGNELGQSDGSARFR